VVSSEQQFIVEVAERLDRFLAARLPGFSRAQVRGLLREGAVRVGGKVVRTGVTLVAGDVVRVQVAELVEVPVAEPELALSVVFAGPGMVLCDKPAGQPTAPLRPDERGTLVNALVARYPEMRGVGFGPLEPGLLNRLDNETSGLVLAARSREAWNAVHAQLERGEVVKHYLALVVGQPPETGEIDLPLVHGGKRMRPAAGALSGRGEGQPAHTSFTVQRRWRGHCLLAVRIRQGVHHQIRAHLAASGWPIAGDELSGGGRGPVARHFLHAWRVDLPHPVSGEITVFEAPLPAELDAWMVVIS
jgi:23S rRNA pseudouridine1911/1915/1917 synthase